MARAGRQAAAAESSMSRYSSCADRRNRTVDTIPRATPPLTDAAMEPEPAAIRSLGFPRRGAKPTPRASTRDRNRGAAAMTAGNPASCRPRARARNG